MQQSYAHCEALVRAADKDRYLAGLFLPAAVRPHAFALYAFNAEIAQVRERARQALAGEIRLQWWRDALAGREAAAASGTPVAAALLDTAERHALPYATLAALIEARQFDLYEEPMRSLDELEFYLRATTSSLFGLVARLAGGSETASANAAHFAGLAYGLTGLLRAFALHAARGQLYVPLDVLERHGARREAIPAGRTGPELAAALGEVRGRARAHLAQARVLLAGVPSAALPAFLPLALVEPYLAQMERSDYDPFKSAIEVPQWRRQWALWRAARRRI